MRTMSARHPFFLSPSSARSVCSWMDAWSSLCELFKEFDGRAGVPRRQSTCRLMNDAAMSCASWVASLANGTTSSRGNHYYSQSRQDHILRTIFQRIGTSNREAVEFGFGYAPPGLHGERLLSSNVALNTRALGKEGWRVTYFDALIEDSEANVRQVLLTEGNIVQAFHNASIPREVDYVSIDVDSIDVWLLRALLLHRHYRPRVISIEYNRNFLLDMFVTCQRTWHAWTGRSVFGASASAINLVASDFGYLPVHVMREGYDIFLVREDILREHAGCSDGLPSFESLVNGTLGVRHHRRCSAQDAARLVDLRLELGGQHEAAKAAALRDVVRLNALHPHTPMCNLSWVT